MSTQSSVFGKGTGDIFCFLPMACMAFSYWEGRMYVERSKSNSGFALFEVVPLMHEWEGGMGNRGKELNVLSFSYTNNLKAF